MLSTYKKVCIQGISPSIWTCYMVENCSSMKPDLTWYFTRSTLKWEADLLVSACLRKWSVKAFISKVYDVPSPLLFCISLWKKKGHSFTTFYRAIKIFSLHSSYYFLLISMNFIHCGLWSWSSQSTYCDNSCLLTSIFSRELWFLIRNDSTAGLGFSVSTRTMPAGKDSVMSPITLARQLKVENIWSNYCLNFLIQSYNYIFYEM